MADVSAAASALGIPEALVQRSVAARAAASGASVDDLLDAWAGGQAPPAPADQDQAPAEPDEAAAGEVASEEPEPERVEATAPEVVVEVPSEPAPAPAPAPAGPYRPPVLVGTKDNPTMVFVSAISLFFIVVMIGLVGPSIPIDEPGARTSEIAFSETALEGRQVYLSVGCESCHTQMVRPIVADIGLGPVTLGDTNQILGTRRFGPDLSDVGSRVTASQIEATIGGLAAHPAQSLGDEEMQSLVAYLVESSTSPSEQGS